MQQVSITQLRAVADRLNRLTGSPMQAYVKNADGRHVAQVGNYHISQAYGGVCLHRMYNEGGGVSDPLNSNHVPKRELLSLMFAYIAGIEAGRVAA